MSLVLDEPVAGPAPRRPRADTLAASVIILLVMTVAQRLIGFGRGVLFCRWLELEQLGEWDIAFGFLNLAAPLAVLGLPGAFGRYVEYYRARGQFHTFLRRTATVSAVMCAIALLAMMGARHWFSRLIFGYDQDTRLVLWLAVRLVTVIAHNFLTSLFIAVRMYRIVTVLQFVQSLGFALLSVVLITAGPGGATSAVIAYTVATLLSGIGAIGWLRNLNASETQVEVPVPQSTFWAKLLPFAMWMWITNLVANLFDVVDRFMIIHYSGMQPNEALCQVGYYHTSRIIPVLFVTVTALLGSMITPHLSHDWEFGSRKLVVRRLNMALKFTLYGLFAASVAVLFAAPTLFRVAFAGKFEHGLHILPCTLAYCAWFGSFAIAQNYLWCAECAGRSSLALAAGLLLNIVLNLLLLPHYGLEGAVWSTTVANFVALTLVYLLSIRQGMHVDLGTWVLTVALASLCLGAWPSLLVLIALSAWAVAGKGLLLVEEKGHLHEMLEHGVQKLARLRRRYRAADAPAEIF